MVSKQGVTRLEEVLRGALAVVLPVVVGPAAVPWTHHVALEPLVPLMMQLHPVPPCAARLCWSMPWWTFSE